jgi:hypothetical protein
MLKSIEVVIVSAAFRPPTESPYSLKLLRDLPRCVRFDEPRVGTSIRQIFEEIDIRPFKLFLLLLAVVQGIEYIHENFIAH